MRRRLRDRELKQLAQVPAVHADGEVAFCSFLYHVTGTLGTGDEVSMWVRATLGLRRIDGEWMIVHDHESVPWDAETGQGRIDLAPQDA